MLSAKSTYFKAICASGIKEAVLESSITKEEDGSTLDTVVRYIYLGKSNITVHNVEKIAIASDFLGHKELKSECEKILLDSLDVSKLMSYHKLSKKADMSALKTACTQLAKEKFTEVVGSQWFRALTVDEAQEYLIDDDLNVTAEDDVLHAICSWLKNSNERSAVQEQHIDKLFQCVRLKFCQNSTLESLSKDATIMGPLRLKISEFLLHGYHGEGEVRKSYSTTYSASAIAASEELPRESVPDTATREKLPLPTKAARRTPLKEPATPSSPSAKLPVASPLKVKEEVLIVGGRKTGNKDHKNIVFLDKDPEDCIMAHAPICASCNNYSACASKNTIIVSGGCELSTLRSTSKVQKFSVTDHRWVDLPDLPFPVDLHGSAYVSEKLYTFGGRFRENRETKRRYSSVNVLDLASLSWEECQPLPIAVRSPGIAAIEENIYAVGGSTGGKWSCQTVKMNTRTGTITRCQSMPKGGSSAFCSTVTVHPNIYVLHAILFAQYDTSKDQWTELKMPIKPSHCAAMVLKQNHMIMLGGYKTDIKDPNDVIQKYDLPSKTWSLEGRKMPLPLSYQFAFMTEIPQSE